MENITFEASVSINDKRFFELDIENNFSMYAETRKQLVKNISNKLKNAKITYYNENTSRFGSGLEAKNEIKEYWEEIRDFIIQDLKDGEDYTFVEIADVDIMSVIIK